MIEIDYISPLLASDLCRIITADLPEYFGLPEANEHYANGMLDRHSIAIKNNGEYIALITLEHPYPNNANIYWLAIKKDFHRRGIGTILLNEACRYAMHKGASSLTVETLAPIGADENYLKTYKFYEQNGLKPLFNLRPSGYDWDMVYMHKTLYSSNKKPLVKIEFTPLRPQDIAIISAAFTAIGWRKPETIYEKYLQEQMLSERLVWLAWQEGKFAGYITLLWQSKYAPFSIDNIPEIADLNVLPILRTQGIAMQLLDLAEAAAAKNYKQIGLGVGLYADYATAHRLYLKRGYIPDGNGISYQNQLLQYNQQLVLDDDLILWFTKRLT